MRTGLLSEGTPPMGDLAVERVLRTQRVSGGGM